MLDNYHCHTHMLCVRHLSIFYSILCIGYLTIHAIGLKTFILTDIPQFG